MLNQSHITLNLQHCLPSQIQKTVLLSTCSSNRKFLNSEVHLSEEEADSHYQVSRIYTPISVFPDAAPADSWFKVFVLRALQHGP